MDIVFPKLSLKPPMLGFFLEQISFLCKVIFFKACFFYYLYGKAKLRKKPHTKNPICSEKKFCKGLFRESFGKMVDSHTVAVGQLGAVGIRPYYQAAGLTQ